MFTLFTLKSMNNKKIIYNILPRLFSKMMMIFVNRELIEIYWKIIMNVSTSFGRSLNANHYGDMKFVWNVKNHIFKLAIEMSSRVNLSWDDFYGLFRNSFKTKRSINCCHKMYKQSVHHFQSLNKQDPFSFLRSAMKLSRKNFCIGARWNAKSSLFRFCCFSWCIGDINTILLWWWWVITLVVKAGNHEIVRI